MKSYPINPIFFFHDRNENVPISIALFLEKNLTMHNRGKFDNTRHLIFCYYMQMRFEKVRSRVVFIYGANIFAA